MEEETAREPVEMTTDHIRTIFSETSEIFETAVQTILKQQTAKYGPDAMLMILMALKENCQQYINAFDYVIRGESLPEEEPETTSEPLADFYFSEQFKDTMQKIHGSERKIITTFFQGKEYNFVLGHGEPLPADLIFTDYVFVGTGKESETITT